MLLQLGEGRYRIVDGSITNCRLPHPDWRIIAHSINLDDKNASTSNAFFEFLGIPIFYLPYLHHPANETGRVSGLLIPAAGILPPRVSSLASRPTGQSTAARTCSWAWITSASANGRQMGISATRARAWTPLLARWNGLIDRGIEEEIGNTLASPSSATKTDAVGIPNAKLAGPVGYELINQGGIDVTVLGRKDLRRRLVLPAQWSICPATCTGLFSMTTTRRPSAQRFPATWP